MDKYPSTPIYINAQISKNSSNEKIYTNSLCVHNGKNYAHFNLVR